MFHVATKEFGGADIVCPGAGVFEPASPPSPILHLSSRSNKLSALFQLLASPRHAPISRLTNLQPLLHPRHKPHPPNPHHATCPLPFPLPLPQRLNHHHHPPTPKINPSHLLRSRPNNPPSRAHLQRHQTRPQRLRPQPLPAPLPPQHPRHSRSSRCNTHSALDRTPRKTTHDS